MGSVPFPGRLVQVPVAVLGIEVPASTAATTVASTVMVTEPPTAIEATVTRSELVPASLRSVTPPTVPPVTMLTEPITSLASSVSATSVSNAVAVPVLVSVIV